MSDARSRCLANKQTSPMSLFPNLPQSNQILSRYPLKSSNKKQTSSTSQKSPWKELQKYSHPQLTQLQSDIFQGKQSKTEDPLQNQLFAEYYTLRIRLVYLWITDIGMDPESTPRSRLHAQPTHSNPPPTTHKSKTHP